MELTFTQVAETVGSVTHEFLKVAYIMRVVEEAKAKGDVGNGEAAAYQQWQRTGHFCMQLEIGNGAAFGLAKYA